MARNRRIRPWCGSGIRPIVHASTRIANPGARGSDEAEGAHHEHRTEHDRRPPGRRYRQQRFCEYASTHPEEVHFVLEAAGSFEGRVAHTRATTGAYTLGGQRIDRLGRRYVHHLGAHKEVEDALGFTEPTDREEATEVVRAALTGCINTAVSASAVARGIELSRLETRVSIGWDPFVFLHLREADANGGLVNQFRDLKVELVIEGEGLTEDDRAYLRDSIRRSAVYNLLTLGHANAPVVEVAAG